MSWCLVLAGVVPLVTAAIHTVMGEQRIFRRLAGGSPVPAIATPRLQPQHVRILWA